MTEASGPATVLLFDVMDTLVVEPYWEALPAFFGMSFEELVATKHPTAWIEFELGRLDEPAYLARFFRDGRPVDGEALRAHLRRSYRFVEGMETLLADLRAADHVLHALSNYPLWYRLIEAELTLSRFLNWTFVSCDTGVRKPDSRAFLGPPEALGVAPERCVLVDDRAENITAARRWGLDGIHFTDAATLRRDLGRRGLL